MKRTLVTFICLLLFSTHSFAQTLYVSDRLKINMRSGPSTANKITATLRSGTPLTVVSRDKSSGYSQVKLKSGKSGWVLTRQLDKQPSARKGLIIAQEKNAALQKQLDDITSAFEKVTNEYESANQSLQQNLFQNKTLTEELTDIRQKASNALMIERERNELKATLEITERKFKKVSQRNEILEQSDRNVLFMLGAGTIVFGLFLGLILPRLGAKKRSGSWGGDSYLG